MTDPVYRLVVVEPTRALAHERISRGFENTKALAHALAGQGLLVMVYAVAGPELLAILIDDVAPAEAARWA